MPGAVTPQQIKNQQNALKGVSGTVKAPPPVPKGKPSKAVTTAPKAATKPVPTQLPTLFRHGSNAEPFPAKPPKLSPVEQKQASANTKALAQQQQAKQVNAYLASTAGKAKPELPSIVHAASQGVSAVGHGVSDIRNAISHATLGGSAGTGRGGGGGAPSATLAVQAGATRIGLNALKDAVDIPAEAIPSTYLAGKAAVQAIGGHPKALEQMASSTLKGLTTLKGWENHPVSNALMLSGGASAIGRVGDVGLRLAGKGGDLARAPEVLYGRLRVNRLPYSRDPLIRARQKIADNAPKPDLRVPVTRGKKTATIGGGMNVKIARAIDQMYGTTQTAWRNKRGEIERQRVEAVTAPRHPGRLARQAASTMKITRVDGRWQGHAQEPLTQPPIYGKEAVNPILQAIIRRPDTAEADLRKYRDLVASHEFKPGTEAEANQHATLGHIDGLLHDRHFLQHPHEAFDAAGKAAKDLNALQPELVNRGHVTEEAAKRSPLLPYARLHMGAEPGETIAAREYDAARKTAGDANRRFALAEKAYEKAAPEDKHAHLAVLQAARESLKAAQQKANALKVTEREGMLHTSGDRTGHVVSNDEILAHMRNNGVNPDRIAYLTHKPVTDEAARYSSMTRPMLAGNKRRTTEAFASGQVDLTHDAIIKQHLSSALKIHTHDFQQRVLDRLVLRKGGTTLPRPGQKLGDFKDSAEARRAATDPEFRAAHNVPDNVKLVPYRITPMFAGKNQMTAIKAGLEPLDPFLHDVEGHPPTPFTDAVKGTEPGSYGLIAQSAAKRLAEHEQSSGTFMRGIGASRSLFTKAVLPFSFKRLVGVPQETGLRLAIGRAGITSTRVANKVLDTMRSEEFQRANSTAQRELDNLTAQLFGGTQSGQAMRLTRFTPSTTYQGYRIDGLPDLLRSAKGVPTVGHVIKTLDVTTNKILGLYKHKIEVPGQKAAFGKFLIDSANIGKATGFTWARALTLQQRAFEDLAKGMLDSANQDAAARYVNDMMGKWSNHSPVMQDILKFSPFLSWYVNSLKFMYATLPHQHPVLTGLLAASNTATAEQRAAVGLSGPFSGNPLEVPGYMEGGAPIPGGKILDLAHYSPFSAVGDIAGAPASEFLPQITPVYQGLMGDDFTGQYPKNAAGVRAAPPVTQRLWMAAQGLFGSITPLQAILRLHSPASYSQIFRIYTDHPATFQPSGLGVSSSDLGISPGQLGTSKSDLGVSNTQLGIP